MESKKLVLFGAGKIGRSFIGQLFSRSGFEVIFVDVNDRIISELNQKKRYRVIIKSDDRDKDIWIDNVRGIHGANIDLVASEIAEADLLAMSVGQKAIPFISPVIAKGIKLRYQKHPDFPLDIILAENLRDAAKVVADELNKYLDNAIELDNYVGLIETSIGKMVPIMPVSVEEEDALLVYAEPYNTLILDQKAFKNPIPEVEGIAPKENMPAWVDRKSFIHNLGHAAAAYYGFIKYPELKYVYEVMAKKDVYEATRNTMLQATDILMKAYPDEFTNVDLITHVDDLIHRFGNKALGDTVFRVGQDLYRKLGPEDRLVGALKLALKYRMPYDRILYIIACSIGFRATDEQETQSESDLKFSMEAELGISHILASVCKIDADKYPRIHAEANEIVI